MAVFFGSMAFTHFNSKPAVYAPLKAMVTGATGRADEGVFLECLRNTAVAEVWMINRPFA